MLELEFGDFEVEGSRALSFCNCMHLILNFKQFFEMVLGNLYCMY
jgi:hypothetical protein